MSSEFDDLEFTPYTLSSRDLEHLEFDDEASHMLSFVAIQLRQLERFDQVEFNREFCLIRLVKDGRSAYWRWTGEAMTEILSALVETIELEAERELENPEFGA